MARRTNQPSTATRHNTSKTRAETNGRGSLDERREGLTAVRDEQVDDRNDSRENSNGHDNHEGREFGENRDERNQHDGYAKQGFAARASPGMDTFAPVLEA